MSWIQRDKTLQDTITFTDIRKSPLVIQNQEALWRKLDNLKPLFGSKRKCSCIMQRAIMLTRNSNCKKIILCVTTSQHETSSRNYIILFS